MSKDFIKVPLEGQPDEQLEEFITVIGHVVLNRAHIVSVQFNVTDATLVVTSTTSIGSGRTMYRWEQSSKVVKAKEGARVVPDPGKFEEKSYDSWMVEPAAIVVRDRESIKRIWAEVYPDTPFTGFEEHEELVNKLAELRSQKEKELEEKAAKAKLGLVKADGETPLSNDTVDKPTILGPDGEATNIE